MSCSTPKSAVDPAVFKNTERWDNIERHYWSVILERPSAGFFTFDDNFFNIILNTREKFVKVVIERTDNKFADFQVEEDLKEIAYPVIYKRFASRFISLLDAEKVKYNALLVSPEFEILGIVQESKFFSFINPLSGTPLSKEMIDNLLTTAACIAHEEFSRAAEEVIAKYTENQK